MAVEILAFNKWSARDLVVTDPGLKDYMVLTPRIVPKSSGRYAGSRFHKSKIFIVERLINRLMVPGHRGKKHSKSSGRCTGKHAHASGLVKAAFEKIQQKLQKNPVEVFVQAVQNAAPREETITIEYGGARYPRAVECSPQRRIDLVLRYMTQGSYQRGFNTRKSAVDCLADEIIGAYNLSQQSAAISKKLELERQADASR
ncbi:TPA: 30S ribosomal protein S7 [Candidatus Woesearchaeota archaeon]|nr:MAG: small subunit ribosomal protein S7 [archaeon GW2011_AR16]HIG96224.1 30S ribosomal protein S7 [Candidatus Woesearchaeota archaeon]HIH48585.1 30S ribosomal protein S7 [Candidatus Woesearchaeota archaeon]HII89058.1 30S ribosomal protein S7 [Candidatus Woesearchaeota archaeon]